MMATRRPVCWQARITSRASGVGVAVACGRSFGVSQRRLDPAGGIQVEAGRVPEHLDRVVLPGYCLRQRLAVGAEQLAESGARPRGGESGEDAADRPVEVEQQVARAPDDAAQLDRGRCRHGAGSWPMVLQMLSNQARASSTYWEPIEVSSSPMVWWNSIASLPIRS